ncbi:methyltransferase [Erythrobacter sp. MTPC3]|uniref:methyltransferase n=1 Tax=Erythrobacter sp. MTPC3 TaxID=3056564 RepID=UPI0036F30BE5
MNTAPPRIFDRTRSSAKWNRARTRQKLGGAANYLNETLGDDLAERLDFMNFTGGKALIVGDAPEPLSRMLLDSGTVINAAPLGLFDEEAPDKFEAYDLVIHLLGLGMVNDLPGALIHARNALADGGLFMAAFPGAGSLPVLRQLALVADGDRPAARMHPQVDNRAGTALLERAGFSRQVVDSYAVNVRYSAAERLVEDLRDHGLTSSLASPAPPVTRTGWERARKTFDDLREDDGKVTETFEILTLTGWR